MTPAGLEILEARVKGSGAGMDPPEGSVLKDGWWTYKPKIDLRPTINLAASGATGGGWTLCADRSCLELGAEAGEPVELSACAEPRKTP